MDEDYEAGTEVWINCFPDGVPPAATWVIISEDAVCYTVRIKHGSHTLRLPKRQVRKVGEPFLKMVCF